MATRRLPPGGREVDVVGTWTALGVILAAGAVVIGLITNLQRLQNAALRGQLNALQLRVAELERKSEDCEERYERVVKEKRDVEALLSDSRQAHNDALQELIFLRQGPSPKRHS